MMCFILEHLDVERRLELQKDAFASCRHYIVQHLSPDDIVDHLISQRLIGDSACGQLSLPIKTAKQKNRIIVDELSSGGPGTLEKFCTVLKKSRRTKHIADYVEKGMNKLSVEDVNLWYYCAYIRNCLRKKVFADFVNLGAFANIFLCQKEIIRN